MKKFYLKNAQESFVAIDAAGAAGAAGAGSVSGCSDPLGIPTVITDDKEFPQSLQVVDFEREIGTFDTSESVSKLDGFVTFDAEAEKLQRWLLLRQAQRILAFGPEAFVMKKKFDDSPWSPWYGPDFVGPVKVRHTKVPRLVVAKGAAAAGPLVQAEHLEPKFRTVLCTNRVVPGRDSSVWQARESKNCSWHDLIVCASPWFCPICSPRINLGRQRQINKVYEAIKTVGGSAYMLTFTVPHGIGDDCGILVNQMKAAMQLLQKTQEWKNATRTEAPKRIHAKSIPFLDYLGRIAALEVTHGQHGFHPHEHHLWFFKRKLTVREIYILKRKLFDAWLKCCIEVGLPAPLRKYGLDIRIALSAAEYIAKFADLGRIRRWGPEKEIASSHSKKAGKGGRSMMQILSDSLNLDTYSEQGEFRMNADAFLFLDFANAFIRKHQIQMSDSLKKWLRECGIDIDDTEAGEAELASALEAESDLQFEVDADDFRCIAKNKAQYAVLSVCKSLGADAALKFISTLPGRITTERETVDFNHRSNAALSYSETPIFGFDWVRDSELKVSRLLRTKPLPD